MAAGDNAAHGGPGELRRWQARGLLPSHNFEALLFIPLPTSLFAFGRPTVFGWVFFFLIIIFYLFIPPATPEAGRRMDIFPDAV